MKKEKFLIFVDGDKFEWEKETISFSELRTLAAIPEGVQVFLEVPGKPDIEFKSDSPPLDLIKQRGPARFSTQSPGSQAG